MFRGSPAGRAACWSNDLIRFALITVLLVTIYCSIRGSEREGEGVIERGIVSLSSCQAQCCIVLLCLGEVCLSSRAEIQNESAEKVLAGVLIQICYQHSGERYDAVRKRAPFESHHGKKKRSRTCGRLPFHKQRYRRQTFLTASASSWHCAREL